MITLGIILAIIGVFVDSRLVVLGLVLVVVGVLLLAGGAMTY